MLFLSSFAEQADERKTKNMTTEEQTPVAAEIATEDEIRLRTVQLLASVDYHISSGKQHSEVLLSSFKKLAAHFPYIEWRTK